MSKLLNVIVACAENRVIGRNGKLPWHIPEDLAFFHAATAGQNCILGRICFETWPRAAQEGRRPIVVSRNTALASPGVVVTSSLNSAIAIGEKFTGEIFVCGGQRIYE